jgi:hypothetical protein
MRKLKQIGAWWKNDKPDGCGYIFDDEQFVNELARSVAEHTAPGSEWDRLGTAEMLSQLADIARRNKTNRGNTLVETRLSIEDAVVATGNITVLQRRGAIPDDNFNGVVYYYVETT